MRAGAIALYEEALHGQAAPLILRTADGRALPLQVSRWCGHPFRQEQRKVEREPGNAGPAGRLAVIISVCAVPPHWMLSWP
jgi:hypothetical protein